MLNKRQLLKIFSTICGMGFILGIILSFTINTQLLTNYSILYSASIVRPIAICNNFLSYILPLFVVWILAFTKKYKFISGFIVFFKGTSLGFVSSFLLQTYAFWGLAYIIILYLPQNLLLVPLYIFLAATKKQNTTEYILLLAFVVCVVFFISLYDIFVLPRIIQFIIG